MSSLGDKLKIFLDAQDGNPHSHLIIQELKLGGTQKGYELGSSTKLLLLEGKKILSYNFCDPVMTLHQLAILVRIKYNISLLEISSGLVWPMKYKTISLHVINFKGKKPLETRSMAFSNLVQLGTNLGILSEWNSYLNSLLWMSFIPSLLLLIDYWKWAAFSKLTPHPFQKK